MTTVDLNAIELIEFTGKQDRGQHCRATFPLLGHHGTKEIATVYFELDPGDNLGMHTDSAEELLVVLQGDVDITIGKEIKRASQNTIALVPKLIPHDIKNVGSGKVSILGVFGGANHIVATFEQEWLPTHSNVVDTAQSA